MARAQRPPPSRPKVPSSRFAPDSYCGRVEARGGFRPLWIDALLFTGFAVAVDGAAVAAIYGLFRWGCS